MVEAQDPQEASKMTSIPLREQRIYLNNSLEVEILLPISSMKMMIWVLVSKDLEEDSIVALERVKLRNRAKKVVNNSNKMTPLAISVILGASADLVIWEGGSEDSLKALGALIMMTSFKIVALVAVASPHFSLAHFLAVQALNLLKPKLSSKMARKSLGPRKLL